MDPIAYTIALGAAGAAEDSYWILALTHDYGYYDNNDSITVDANDNVYVTLTPSRTEHMSMSVGHGFPTVMKLDKDGSIQWARQLYQNSAVSKDTKTGEAGVDSSGNVYLSCGLDQNTFHYAKWNSSGSNSFIKATTGSSHAHHVGMCDSNGNYICAGEIQTSYVEACVKKIASNGNITWSRGLRTTSPGRRSRCHGMDLDSSDNIYMTGRTRIDTGYEVMYIAKLSSSGTTTWQRTIQESGDNNDAFGYDVAVDGSGNTYAVGRFTSTDGVVMKLNSGGIFNWVKKISEGPYCMAGVVADSAGNVYTLGKDSSTGDIILLKFNTNGVLQFARKFTHSSNFVDPRDRQNPINIDSDGNLYIKLQEANNYYMYILKLPNDGSLTGTYSFSGVSMGSITYATTTVTVSSATTATDTPTSSEFVNNAISVSSATPEMVEGAFNPYQSSLNTIS